METYGEPECCIRESFNCPHFQRNTCVIHFTCCDDWYPCHKCHNDSLERQENDKPSVANPEDNFVESDIAEDGDDLGEGSSNATGISHELEASPRTVEFDDAKMELRARNSDAPNGENNKTATDYESLRNGDNKVLSGMEVENSVSGENNQSENTTLCGKEEESDAQETSSNTETSLSKLNGFEEWCLVREESISRARSSGQVAEGAGELKGITDDALASDIKEESPNTTDGSSDHLKNNEEIGVRKNMMQGNDENNFHLSLATKKEHALVKAQDGSRLKCLACNHIQSKFCQKCEKESCGKTFASYFCPECKLLIESGGSASLQPYHCGLCGVCRLNKGENFHCRTCNVCMPLSLRDHKCFDNRGHDPCAICLEEVFSGAVILPCFHMIHEDCGVKLILSGSDTCPMCRGTIIQNKEAEVVVEESQTSREVASNSGILTRVRDVFFTSASNILKTICSRTHRATPNEMSTAPVSQHITTPLRFGLRGPNPQPDLDHPGPNLQTNMDPLLQIWIPS